MNLLPPLPAWNGMHPLIVHFPIALLMVAPLLVATALFWKSLGRGLQVAAFALMLMGTAATWVAVSTGAAAGEAGEKTATSATERVIEQHEELAETTRTVFTVLTLVFAALIFAPALLRRPLGGVSATAAHAVFLCVYAGGLVFLVNTAHQGGRIVHEFGLRAAMSPAQSTGGVHLPDSGREDEAEEARERGEHEARGVGTRPVGEAASPAGSSPVSPARPSSSPASGQTAAANPAAPD